MLFTALSKSANLLIAVVLTADSASLDRETDFAKGDLVYCKYNVGELTGIRVELVTTGTDTHPEGKDFIDTEYWCQKNNLHVKLPYRPVSEYFRCPRETRYICSNRFIHKVLDNGKIASIPHFQDGDMVIRKSTEESMIVKKGTEDVVGGKVTVYHKRSCDGEYQERDLKPIELRHGLPGDTFTFPNGDVAWINRDLMINRYPSAFFFSKNELVWNTWTKTLMVITIGTTEHKCGRSFVGALYKCPRTGKYVQDDYTVASVLEPAKPGQRFEHPWKFRNAPPYTWTKRDDGTTRFDFMGYDDQKVTEAGAENVIEHDERLEYLQLKIPEIGDHVLFSEGWTYAHEDLPETIDKFLVTDILEPEIGQDDCWVRLKPVATKRIVNKDYDIDVNAIDLQIFMSMYNCVETEVANEEENIMCFHDQHGLLRVGYKVSYEDDGQTIEGTVTAVERDSITIKNDADDSEKTDAWDSFTNLMNLSGGYILTSSCTNNEWIRCTNNDWRETLLKEMFPDEEGTR